MTHSLQGGLFNYLLNEGFPVSKSMSIDELLTAATVVPGDGVIGNPMYLEKTFADAPTGDTIVLAVAPTKLKLIACSVLNKGANGANANTVQICAAAAGASPVTDAMSLNNVAAKTIVGIATIDDTYSTFAAGSTIYARRTRAGGVLTGVIRAWFIAVQ